MVCSVFVSFALLLLSLSLFLSPAPPFCSSFFFSFILFFELEALRLGIGSVAGYRILDKGRREMESSVRDSWK